MTRNNSPRRRCPSLCSRSVGHGEFHARNRYLDIDMVFTEGRFYRYEPAVGYWTEVPDHALRKRVSNFSGKPLVVGSGKLSILKVKKSDVDGAVNLAASRAWERDFFNHNATGLVLQNGFVAVRGDHL